MIIRPFEPKDLESIEIDADIRLPMKNMVPVYESGTAITVVTDRIIACTGLIPTTLGAHLWAVVAKGAPMVVLHKIALRALSTYDIRISATVESGFMPGCRWLEMLGFTRLEIAEGYGHDGLDHIVYARNP